MDILIEEYEENIWSVAIDNKRIEGLEIDPPSEKIRYGSIFYAKVAKIDKALDAAFMDLDGENTGILYNRDIRYKDKSGKTHKGGERAIGKILKAGDLIPVQAKTSYITTHDTDPWYSEDKTAQVSMDITLPGRYLIYCTCLLYTSPSPRDQRGSRMPSSA